VFESLRRAGVAVRLAVVSVVAGLLVAAIALPVVGAVGVGSRNAARAFNSLKVPQLGEVPERSELVNRYGKLIAYYYPHNIDRVPVSYNQIAPVMRNAIVAIEDSRYYQHGAFDLRGTLRAILNNLEHKPIQGASTIAQQYVKNALILTAANPSQQAAATAETLGRKIRELRMAAIVEHEMTKNQLLAAYLSVAYFENDAYGISVAAQRYFSTTPAKLTLTQAATLAGLVENPAAYNPFVYPKAALARRNVVLARMAQLGYISQARARAAEAAKLRLHPGNTQLESGCVAQSARSAAFFCDYVLAVMRQDKAYAKAWNELNTVGGLRIYTTLDPQDQRAANNAVNYVVPARSSVYNPGHNADTEVLLQPGTGRIRAIAVDRPYGTGPGQTTVDYAVNTQYDGSFAGVQTGSSSKIFTLITALKQGIPFGWHMHITSPTTVTGYTNCQGAPTSPFPVTNAEGRGSGIFTLYNGTTQSINVFYAHLEQKVGLCNVVKTAASMGLRRVDGTSLFKWDRRFKPHGYPADDIPSFTLGDFPVSPMSMATAYATVDARGVYCHPIAISAIVDRNGRHLPIESAHCRRVLSPAVADAANYILQGVLVNGTAAGRGIGRPAAGKTGTSNGGYYAAFAGYTPTLVGYVSVFNPVNAERYPMVGYTACYREVGGGQSCPGQMFGDNAPAATWQLTFMHAKLGPALSFVGVPPNSPFFSMGNGQQSPKPPPKKKPPKPPHKHGGGGRPPTPHHH
jgi:membrane peptidoglycan carboxypeptidase